MPRPTVSFFLGSVDFNLNFQYAPLQNSKQHTAVALSEVKTASRADFEFVSTENAPRTEKKNFLDKIVLEYP